jgi:hypothetical protein
MTMSFRMHLVSLLAMSALATQLAAAAALHAPSSVPAGQAFVIQTEGSGEGTFYLLGPSSAVKRTIQLGSDVSIAADKVTAAGQYQAIVCEGNDCAHASFEVVSGATARLSFFLHPSRVPVSTPNVIDGTAFLFDRYYNPVLSPAKVEFQIAPAAAAPFSRVIESKSGVAWMRMGSTAKEGPVRVTAAIGDVKEPRVIQQVAAEACQLRVKAMPGKRGVIFETDPVRDCSGNPLPDGTIVSFTKTDSSGMTTVDTPIKKGIALTELPVKGSARITVACGVVLGNELSIAEADKR